MHSHMQFEIGSGEFSLRTGISSVVLMISDGQGHLFNTLFYPKDISVLERATVSGKVAYLFTSNHHMYSLFPFNIIIRVKTLLV